MNKKIILGVKPIKDRITRARYIIQLINGRRIEKVKNIVKLTIPTKLTNKDLFKVKEKYPKYNQEQGTKDRQEFQGSIKYLQHKKLVENCKHRGDAIYTIKEKRNYKHIKREIEKGRIKELGHDVKEDRMGRILRNLYAEGYTQEQLLEHGALRILVDKNRGLSNLRCLTSGKRVFTRIKDGSYVQQDTNSSTKGINRGYSMSFYKDGGKR